MERKKEKWEMMKNKKNQLISVYKYTHITMREVLFIAQFIFRQLFTWSYVAVITSFFQHLYHIPFTFSKHFS